MGKYDALFEDENDIISGTPETRYWDISGQLSQDLIKDEFDKIVERLAVMEAMLSETHDYEDLDQTIKQYYFQNMSTIDNMKKSVYMELAGQLVYRVAE